MAFLNSVNAIADYKTAGTKFKNQITIRFHRLIKIKISFDIYINNPKHLVLTLNNWTIQNISNQK